MILFQAAVGMPSSSQTGALDVVALDHLNVVGVCCPLISQTGASDAMAPSPLALPTTSILIAPRLPRCLPTSAIWQRPARRWTTRCCYLSAHVLGRQALARTGP